MYTVDFSSIIYYHTFILVNFLDNLLINRNRYKLS